MKIIKTFLLIISLNCFSQTGKIEYNIKSIKKDKLDNPMLKGVIKEWNQMSCTLSYNGQKSFFKLNKSIPLNNYYYGISKVIAEVYTGWYQDLELKEAIFNKDILGDTYQVILKRLQGWEITEETKEIEGYTCYKAVRKELNETSRAKKDSYLTFVAWFTPEISVPYGPVGNGGLPGLILRLERPNLVAFTATKITLNKKEYKMPLPKKGKKITMKERSKLMLKSRLVTPD